MLATLRGNTLSVKTGKKSRIVSLLNPSPVVIGIFSEGGQEFQRPVTEEKKFEEKAVIKPLSKKNIEISDLVFPPIEGIAADVLRFTSEKNYNLTISRNSLKIPDYMFINLTENTQTENNKQPEFIPLITQPLIFGNYAGRLVYAGYDSSNADFSYLSDHAYEAQPSRIKNVVYTPKEIIYEFPMPMFSEGVLYKNTSKETLYTISPAEREVSNCQDKISSVVNNNLFKSYVSENTYQISTLRPEIKLDYEAPKLELLGLGNFPFGNYMSKDTTERKINVISLPEYLFKTDDLNNNITEIKINNFNISEYKEEYVPQNNLIEKIVVLPSNLGFDDNLLRERFIAKLDERVKIIEQPEFRYKNKAISVDENKAKDISVYSTENKAFSKIPDKTNAQADNFKQNHILYKSVSVLNNLPEEQIKKETDTIYINYKLDNPFLINANVLDNKNNNPKMNEPYQDSTIYNGNMNNLIPVEFNVESAHNYNSNQKINDVLLQTLSQINIINRLDNLVEANYNGRESNNFSNEVKLDNYAPSSLSIKNKMQEKKVIQDEDQEKNLEKAIEQRELTEERNDNNVESRAYDKEKSSVREDVYKKNKEKLEEKTRYNESSDSSSLYTPETTSILAEAALMAGGGLLAAVLSPFSLLSGLGMFGSKKKDEKLLEEDKATEVYDSGKSKEEEPLGINKEETVYNPKKDSDSKFCYSIKPKLEEKTLDEYKSLIDKQNETEKNVCYITPEVLEKGYGIHEVFPGGLEFTLSEESTKKFGKIGVRGNNRERYGGTLNIKESTLAYQIWHKLVEVKRLMPYIKLDKNVNPFEEISDANALFFDYLIGPHRDKGDHNIRFEVYDEKDNLINDTNLIKSLDPGKYTLKIFLEQKNPDYKIKYGETLEEINKTRELENGKQTPELYSLKENGKIEEGAVALLEGAFITETAELSNRYSESGIKQGTLLDQLHKASIEAGLNPTYDRTNTTENGKRKGENAAIVHFEDGYSQYMRRYTNAKKELVSTLVVEVDLKTGEIKKEPGYGKEGLESVVNGNSVYVPVVLEQGVDLKGMKVDIKELHKSLYLNELKKLLKKKSPSSDGLEEKYPCHGARYREFHNPSLGNESKYACGGVRYAEFHNSIPGFKEELDKILKEKEISVPEDKNAILYSCGGARYSEFHDGSMKALFHEEHRDTLSGQIKIGNRMYEGEALFINHAIDGHEEKSVDDYIKHTFGKAKIGIEIIGSEIRKIDEIDDIVNKKLDPEKELRKAILINGDIIESFDYKLQKNDKISLVYINQTK